LTIDVERRKRTATFNGIDSDLSMILDLLRPLCKVTFFVTGEVAENSPETIRAISREGHEVSCHGLHHERFDALEPSEQLRRIELATQHITNATGIRPVGFRAPEHRGNAATIKALESLGYEYDSTVLPRTPFMRPEAYKKWRFLFAPAAPYHPSRTSIARHGNSTIVELPVSTFVLPFMSELSMRSSFVSDIIGSLLVYRAKITGAPIIYYSHSYDSAHGREMLWLKRVIHTLQKHKVEFLTMHQLANEYKHSKL
jgi:peptidoglycan/xylan/chitin deacetylase (PgdA/CDA1 family)